MSRLYLGAYIRQLFKKIPDAMNLRGHMGCAGGKKRKGEIM